MGGRGVAFVSIAALAAGAMPRGALAQPKDPKAPEEDPRLEPPQTGSGGAAGSAGVPGRGSAAPGTPGAISPPTTSGAASGKDLKDPKVAKKWLQAAQQLVQKASYLAAKNRPEEAKAALEEAAIAYQKAISAGTDANGYAELASVEERLGRLDAAVKHLRVVVHTKPGVRPDVARRASAKLDELSAKVGVVTLTVTPAGASITIGGAELGMSPLPEPLVLLPGTYTLSFQADGFQPKEAEIKIEPGSATERAIELEPVKVIVEPVSPASLAQVARDDRPAPVSRLPLYVGAGITGAGVLGTSIFGILAVRQHATFTAASTSRLDREGARTAGERFALLTDLSLAVTMAAAGFTAYWYFTRSKQHPRKQPGQHEDHRPATGELMGSAPRATGRAVGATPRKFIRTKLDVVPWVQAQSSGVMIAGWF
jgi:hypothetical protein